jgi:hypothetical protein
MFPSFTIIAKPPLKGAGLSPFEHDVNKLTPQIRVVAKTQFNNFLLISSLFMFLINYQLQRYKKKRKKKRKR